MADINVERKERSIWPWIIGLIVLALLLWALLKMFHKDDNPAPAAAPTVVDTAAGGNPSDTMVVPGAGNPNAAPLDSAGAPSTTPAAGAPGDTTNGAAQAPGAGTGTSTTGGAAGTTTDTTRH